MDRKVTENITFDNIYNLIKEGETFTQKITALSENKEYIEFLVNDLIDISSDYFERLIQLIMLDYTDNIIKVQQNGLNTDNIVKFYLNKIMIVVSQKVVDLYYKLCNDIHEADIYIAITYNAIYTILDNYKKLIIEAIEYRDSKRLLEINYITVYIKEQLLEQYNDIPINKNNPILTVYKLITKIINTMILNIEYDIMNIKYNFNRGE